MANQSAAEDNPHAQENDCLRLEIEKLKNENEKLRSSFDQYKDRMGRAVDIKLGSTELMSEDLNNPCSESKLRDMYFKLDCSVWTKFREQLKAAITHSKDTEFRSNLEEAKRCIKEMLVKASHDMQENLLQNLRLNTRNPKTSQFYDLAIHQIQMAIFHEKQMPMDLKIEWKNIPGLQILAEECYRIGCLMALHNPPIGFYWDEQGQYIFPPINEKVESSAKASTDQNVRCEGSGVSIEPTANALLCVAKPGEPETKGQNVEDAVSDHQEGKYMSAEKQVHSVPPNLPEAKQKELRGNRTPKLGDAKSRDESQIREKEESIETVSTDQNVQCEETDVSKKSKAQYTTEKKASNGSKEKKIPKRKGKNKKPSDNSEQEPGEPATKKQNLENAVSAEIQMHWKAVKERVKMLEVVSMNIPSASVSPNPPEDKQKKLWENLISKMEELDPEIQNIGDIYTICLRKEKGQICLKGDAKSTDESQKLDFDIGSLKIGEVSHPDRDV